MTRLQIINARINNMECQFCSSMQFENKNGVITCALCGSVILKETKPTKLIHIPHQKENLSGDDIEALNICNEFKL